MTAEKPTEEVKRARVMTEPDIDAIVKKVADLNEHQPSVTFVVGKEWATLVVDTIRVKFNDTMLIRVKGHKIIVINETHINTDDEDGETVNDTPDEDELDDNDIEGMIQDEDVTEAMGSGDEKESIVDTDDFASEPEVEKKPKKTRVKKA